MALQIRGAQLTGIQNSSIHASADISLSKLSLSDDATFAGDLTLSGANEQSGVLTISNDTESTDHSDGSLIVSGGVGIAKKLFVNSDGDFSGDLTVDGDATIGGGLTITGNLQVDGTTTTINSTTLNVDDLNITVAKGAANSAAADGAGLTIDTGESTESDNPQLTWDATNAEFNFNKALRLDSSLEVDSNIISYGGNFSVLDNSNATKFSVTASNGAVVGGSFSDGSGGSMTGGTVSGSTLSDGTASLSAGSLTGAVNITATTQIQFGTLSDGTISGIKFIDEDNMNSDSASHVPTQQSVKAYVDSQTASGSLDLSSKVDDESIEYDDTEGTLNVKASGITNAMLNGSIANDKLSNSSVTIGGQTIALGGSQDTFTGLASITSTVLTDGTASMTGGALTGLSSVTSSAFVGDLTGDVTGQVSDITNHASGSLSDVSYANDLAVRDMLMVNSSGQIENVYEVIEYIDVDMSSGAGENQAVDITVNHDDDYEVKSMVFLNGQKLRYGADENTNDFYFSGAGEITFQDSTLADGDSLEIRYIVAS